MYCRPSNCFSTMFLLLGTLTLFSLAVPSASAVSTELLLVPTGGSAGDYFGSSSGTAGDVNGDGFDDFIVGAPLNDAAGTDAGRAYLYYGGPLADTTADLTFTGVAAGDEFGCSVGTAGDVNGDGYDDLIIGAWKNDAAGTDAGRAYLYYGGPGADAIADLIFTGGAAYDNLGISVGGAGDVNSNGYDDLIVGAHSSTLGGNGNAYVYYGGPGADATADLTFTGEAFSDKFGFSVGTAGDVNGDGSDDLVVGAYQNGAGGPAAGRAYVYYGGPGADVVADLTFTGAAAGDEFGFSVGTAGDVNGDGYHDLIVGAHYNDAGGLNAGRAYVYYGGPGADAVADLIFTGEAVGDRFGISVGTAGDVNSDGYAELIVGAHGHDTGGENAGRAYVYNGGSLADENADFIFTGKATPDQFGYSVGMAGDVDGDGFGDIIIGARQNGAGGTNAGRAYVYSFYSPYRIESPNGGESWVAGQTAVVQWRGQDAADIEISVDGGLGWSTLAVGVGSNLKNEYALVAPGVTTEFALVRMTYTGQAPSASNSATSAAPFRITTPARPVAQRLQLVPTGVVAGDLLGYSVGNAGDVNGDGFDDVIVGAYQQDAGGTNAGRAYVYWGGPGADTTPDLTLTGEAANDKFGCSVSTAGDVNGDGYDDVIVGAKANGAGGAYAGRAYVYYGGSSVDAVADLILTGEASGNSFGISVGAAGDMNGDGFDDVIVGADRNAAGGGDAGRAYVYFGGPSADPVADLILTGEAPLNYFGLSVGGAGDVNGDGFGDVIVGALGNSAGGSWAGRAYVYYGGSLPDTTPDLLFTGEAANDNFGYSVSTAGDVNGDGYHDLIVGAHYNDAGGLNAGRAYVYYGGPRADHAFDIVFTGEAANDDFGCSVITAGDVNGDGFGDVVVGAKANGAGGSWAGRAYVYFGGPVPDNTADLIFTGEAANDGLGVSVGGGGDVNGDGFDDVIAGAYLNDAGGTDAGRAYVYDCNRYHVLSPSGGDTWNVGALESIAWLGAASADVWLSVDGGDSYSLLDQNVGGSPTSGLGIVVPHQPTRFARVKITPHDATVTGSAKSDSLFTIEASIVLLNLLVTPIDGGGVLLSWETDPGPEDLMGYKVERAVGSSEQWAVLSTMIRETVYLDQAGSEANRYRLTAINGLGEELLLGETALAPGAALSAWPLPYRGGDLHISFWTAGGVGAGSAPVAVAVYDINGRLVRSIIQDQFEAGYQTATWDGTNEHGAVVANGVYFLRSGTAGTSARVKVIISR